MDSMATRFDDLSYLSGGTDRQRQAYRTLTDSGLMRKLGRFDPILVGTIPIGIDIESSDLDIICCFEDSSEFRKTLRDLFGSEQGFRASAQQAQGSLCVTANFVLDAFAIEVFGQAVPTRQQNAYRHMMVEYQLLARHGEAFRQRIIALKRQGYKTEPAFAKALGLSGDPYLALLQLGD